MSEQCIVLKYKTGFMVQCQYISFGMFLGIDGEFINMNIVLIGLFKKVYVVQQSGFICVIGVDDDYDFFVLDFKINVFQYFIGIKFFVDIL